MRKPPACRLDLVAQLREDLAILRLGRRLGEFDVDDRNPRNRCRYDVLNRVDFCKFVFKWLGDQGFDAYRRRTGKRRDDDWIEIRDAWIFKPVQLGNREKPGGELDDDRQNQQMPIAKE